VDFLVEAQTRKGTRWIALDAKLGIHNVRPMPVPAQLKREGLGLSEIWVVTPGGEERRLSEESLQVPIPALSAKLQQVFTG